MDGAGAEIAFRVLLIDLIVEKSIMDLYKSPHLIISLWLSIKYSPIKMWRTKAIIRRTIANVIMISWSLQE